MGRAEENNLVVKGNLISRLHARVEFNRNKFMLIDQSTNGTFVSARMAKKPSFGATPCRFAAKA
jgi:adenylate cyclase